MENDYAPPAETLPRRIPWNKGKIVGAKPPLKPSHVWSIRTKLQMEGRNRDLALFNLAIDSKLRGCDVVAVRVDDVAPSGYAMDRATIRQRKTDRPVRFELTDQNSARDRRVPEADRTQVGSSPVCRSRRWLAWPYYPPVCQTCARMGGQHRSRSGQVRHALIASHEGGPDLPTHWQSARSPALARPYQDRKHRQVSRHRGR